MRIPSLASTALLLAAIVATIDGSLWQLGPRPWSTILPACWLMTMTFCYGQTGQR